LRSPGANPIPRAPECRGSFVQIVIWRDIFAAMVAIRAAMERDDKEEKALFEDAVRLAVSAAREPHPSERRVLEQAALAKLRQIDRRRS
jgi:hypothetical protein